MRALLLLRTHAHDPPSPPTPRPARAPPPPMVMDYVRYPGITSPHRRAVTPKRAPRTGQTRMRHARPRSSADGPS